MLYDVVAKKKLGMLNLTIAGAQGAKGRIRRVIWTPNGHFLALLSKHYVCLADSSLHHLASLHECIRVKSGCWDEHSGHLQTQTAKVSIADGFVYNTVSHLKYILTNGDTGIFRAIPECGGGMYIQALIRNKIYFLTRRGILKCANVDASEELLKLALSRGKLDTVAMLLKNSTHTHNTARIPHGYLLLSEKMPGHAWVGYLKRKGFPEVAYHCVSDPATRAVLATEFADLEAATEAVKALNNSAGWRKLGEVGLKLGNPEVAEK